jgi:hypothetical protein
MSWPRSSFYRGSIPKDDIIWTNCWGQGTEWFSGGQTLFFSNRIPDLPYKPPDIIQIILDNLMDLFIGNFMIQMDQAAKQLFTVTL